ncbi:hypothetical protein PORY_000315, partial [Pneumocystis oryctolagi]
KDQSVERSKLIRKMRLNIINIKNISKDLSENDIISLFSSCGRILESKLSRQANGTQEMIIMFDSCKAGKSALLLNGQELGGSELVVEAIHFGNIEKYIGMLLFYIIIITDYIHAYVSRQFTRFIKYLSYGYIFSDNTLQKGVRLNRKYKISEHLSLVTQTVLKTIKAVNNRYTIDEKIKKINSKYNVLSTIQEKIRIITSYFQLTMNTKTGSKIHMFYVKCCRKCRNIHEEARRLAVCSNLKQNKLKQT